MRISNGRIANRVGVLALAILIMVAFGVSGSKEDHNLIFTGSFSGPMLIYKGNIFSRVSRNPNQLNLTMDQRNEFIKLRQTYREEFLKIDARMAKAGNER